VSIEPEHNRHALAEMARLLDADLTDSTRLALSRSGSVHGGGHQQHDRGQREGDQRGLREDLTRLPPELAGCPGIAHALHTGRRLAQPARGEGRSRPAAGLEEAEGGDEEG